MDSVAMLTNIYIQLAEFVSLQVLIAMLAEIEAAGIPVEKTHAVTIKDRQTFRGLPDWNHPVYKWTENSFKVLSAEDLEHEFSTATCVTLLIKKPSAYSLVFFKG